jgi:hypothetical protein
MHIKYTQAMENWNVTAVLGFIMHENGAQCALKLSSGTTFIFVMNKLSHKKCSRCKAGLVHRLYQVLNGKEEFDPEHKIML